MLIDTFKRVSGGRKGRSISPSLTPVSVISTFTSIKSYHPHKSDKSGGITCIQLDVSTQKYFDEYYQSLSLNRTH